MEMMINFFVNIRNMFYTRSSRISKDRRFGYKPSMSVMMLPLYFAILTIFEKVTGGLSIASVINAGGEENLIEKLVNTIIFYLPFVLSMLLLFKMLDRYERMQLTMPEENKWLSIASIIFLGGIILMFAISAYL